MHSTASGWQQNNAIVYCESFLLTQFPLECVRPHNVLLYGVLSLQIDFTLFTVIRLSVDIILTDLVRHKDQISIYQQFLYIGLNVLDLPEAKWERNALLWMYTWK